MNTELTITAEKIESITNAALKVMSDFATRATPYATYTEKDILSAVIAEPQGDVARFLAGLIAKSIEVVATLDYVESQA
jgi:hypothetical protein